MFTKIALSTLGIAASTFALYCVYFDYRRVRAKDYTKKLRQKRLKQASDKKQSSQQQKVIDLSNPMEREAFLKSEYDKGMSLLMEENNQEAVVHFMNVVQLSPDPFKMVGILRQTLPQELFVEMMQQFQLLNAQMSAGTSTGDTVD